MWCCGGDGLAAGFGCGWYPGGAVEQVAEGVEFADAPFGGGGQVGLDDGEFGQAFDGAPAAAGGALLDFDRADGPLGFVVGEDVQVRAGGEAEDQVLVPLEAAGDRAGGPGGGGVPGQVGPQPVVRDRPVAGDQVIQHRGVEPVL